MTRMTGNRFFAEAMRAYGVSHLFFVPSILGGAMAEIVKNTSRLDDADREAIAVYLRSVPAIRSERRR